MILSALPLTHTTETDGYTANATKKGWLTAILELGAWFGAIMSGFIAEAASRKYGILISTVVFIIGVIIQITAIAGGHQEILAGRFITSVCTNPTTLNIGIDKSQWYGCRCSFYHCSHVQQ